MTNLTATVELESFEKLKKLDVNGTEYWEARSLMPALEYAKWENFENVINKAKTACINSGQAVENHFPDIGKMAEIGGGAARSIKDYKLSRYACYLIAQNGESSKVTIARAQTYFAIQTHKQEQYEAETKNLTDAEKRLHTRKETKAEYKKLQVAAKNSGVSKFGVFNDAGYQGLYGAPLSVVEQEKGVKKGQLLDHAGSTELAANLFRMTQTEEKLRKDGVVDANRANKVHFMVGGKIRETIKEIGGVMPEDLPTERHIKEIEREVKEINTGSTPLPFLPDNQK